MMAVEITEEFVWQNIPRRPRDSHKGTFGSVLAVAGLSLIHILMNPDGTPFTAHTTNVVPFVAVGCGDVKLREGGCLADIAPTMLPYIGLPVPAEMTGKSIIVE